MIYFSYSKSKVIVSYRKHDMKSLVSDCNIIAHIINSTNLNKTMHNIIDRQLIN